MSIELKGSRRDAYQHAPLWLEAVALAVIAAALLAPRVLGLDRFVTPDETLWLRRSANFYYALGQHDLYTTYQTPHPGVTTLWAGTGGFLKRFPEYRGSGLGKVNSEKFHFYLEQYVKIPPLEILTASRQFVVLGILLTLLAAYWYARRLIGLLPAFFAFNLIAFDPFHLALSRLLHLDGLLSSLLLLSLLSFIYYLRQRRSLDLVVSGIAAGLSWLTKSPGLLIALVIGLLALFELAQYLKSRKHALSLKTVWRSALPLLVWTAIGLMVFAVLWPSMWVKPFKSLLNVFLLGLTKAQEGHGSPVFFNGFVAGDGKLGLNFFYFYPLTYVWRTTPVLIVGLLAAVFGYLKKLKPFNRSPTRRTVLGLLLFVAIFVMVLTLSAKKFDRYLLPVYAPLDCIAALGWMTVVYWMLDRRPVSLARYSALFTLSVAIGLQMLLSLRTFPYYFTYYNPILGGGDKALMVMQIGWGEGLDQAANYLNQKEDSEHLHVISWYARGGLSYFFRGHTRMLESLTSLENEVEADRFFSSDYAVVYVHNWQRDIPKSVLEFLSQRTPEHSIWIDGIEYVRIYKIRGEVDKIPMEAAPLE